MSQTENTTRKGETEVTHAEDANSASGPSDTIEVCHKSVATKVMNTIMHECPDGVSLEDLKIIFELLENAMRGTKIIYECFEY